MKQISNLIIFLLCLCLVGFFANFAQNDYGMELVPFTMLFIGILILELLRRSLSNFKKLGYLIHLMIVFPALSVVIWVYDKGDIFMIVSVVTMLLGFIFNLFILPLTIYVLKKKTNTNEFSFSKYYELFFLSLLPISIYLRANHLIGGGVFLTSSMIVTLPYLYQIFQHGKLIFSNKSMSSFFQISVYLFVCSSITGTAFKLQHWPGANMITKITIVLLFVSLALLTLNIVLKKQINILFNSLSTITKIVYFSFCTSGVWLILMFNDLAPEIYSDEYPTAMQYLKANANDITVEGIEFGKRHHVYKQNYEFFLQEQNKVGN